MGAIVGFFMSAFGGLSSLITVMLARKATFSVAYIAIYVSLTLVFIASINSLIAGISNSFPSNSFLVAGFSLLPGNTAQCIGIVSAAHVASFAYTFKNKLLNLKVNA